MGNGLLTGHLSRLVSEPYRTARGFRSQLLPQSLSGCCWYAPCSVESIAIAIMGVPNERRPSCRLQSRYLARGIPQPRDRARKGFYIEDDSRGPHQGLRRMDGPCDAELFYLLFYPLSNTSLTSTAPPHSPAKCHPAGNSESGHHLPGQVRSG